MQRHTGAIDGFVPRRTGRSIGGGASEAKQSSFGKSTLRPSMNAALEPPARRTIGQSVEVVPEPKLSNRSVSRQEIDDSLKDIDDDRGRSEPKKRGLFGRKIKKPASSRKKWTKRFIILLILIVVGIGGFLFVKSVIAGGQIFQGNILGLVQNKPLKMDENGRTNILVFGTSGSFDDKEHEGADLTDTLMVISLDQKKKNAYTVSLPRDLYVEYGATCLEGNRGKINSMYACFTDGQSDVESGKKGAAALQAKVGEIVGLDLQYYAHINWAVVVGSIDAIGGVEVDVQGDGSCGASQYAVIDYNMNIKYEAGVRQMTGEEALRFSRARGAAGGCGLGDGDFDRQLNQQKVLKAMQQKATNAETLTNLGKVTGLISTFGENLRTNFDTSEIQTLMSVGNETSGGKLQPIDLRADDNTLIVSGNIPGAGSTQVPAAGTYDYSEINAFIQKTINANEITKEAAHVALFNGSGVTGYAQERADALTERGFTITAVANAPEASYQKVEIYDLTKTKKATKAKLESFYGVKTKTTSPPITVSEDTDFIVIYGQAEPTGQ